MTIGTILRRQKLQANCGTEIEIAAGCVESLFSFLYIFNKRFVFAVLFSTVIMQHRRVRDVSALPSE